MQKNNTKKEKSHFNLKLIVLYCILIFITGYYTHFFVGYIPERISLSPFGDGVFWLNERPIEWSSQKSNQKVIVPIGFVTDLASIPQEFRAYLSQWGRYGPAAIIHDYLYWEQNCSREEADDIMMEAMEEFEVPYITRHAIYVAVRAGGWLAWNSNEDDKLKGEFRVISKDKFPSNPYETWEECKARIKGEA